MDGQNALNGLGELSSLDAVLYTKNGANNGPNTRGLNGAQDVALDAAGHRLFVSDTVNNRVLVFNLDGSNNLVDRVADNVLGQADFDSNGAAVTQARLNGPRGLAYDSAGQRLFVADYTNNRVIVYDVAVVVNGENAVGVLGQALYTTNTAATTQAGLRNPRGLAYHSGTNRLFVGDFTNNRVIVYDVAVVTNGENAVNVLGQALYTTNTAATTQAGLRGPSGVAFDSGTSRLFVADATNNRVLVFDLLAITNGENAVNVLGQTLFTSSATATTQAGLRAPAGVLYDGAGRLFIGDTGNHRVVVQSVGAIVDGQNAANVLGQANFTTGTAAVAQNRMSSPVGAAFDAANSRLFIADSGNHRVLVHPTGAIANGQNALNGLGELSSLDAVLYTKNGANNGPNTRGLNGAQDVALDAAGHRLFVSDTVNNRVLVFNLDGSNTLVDRVADNVLGQADFDSNGAAVTQARLNGPRGLAYDSAGQRLFVADYTNNRVIVYDLAVIVNGENAVGVLGQALYTTNTAATTQAGLRNPRGLAYHAGTNRLFVGDFTNNRVIVYDVAVVTNGENAANVLGQALYTTNTAATTQAGLRGPSGVAFDSGTSRLFVADATNNRVLVFDLLAVTNGENAVNVLGQTLFTASVAATTQAGLRAPAGVLYDGAGRLFIGDTGNHRVVVQSVGAIVDGQNAANVLGQANFTTGTAAAAQSRMSSPVGAAFDAANSRLFIADSGNHRVLVHDGSGGPPAAPASGSFVGRTTVSSSATWTASAGAATYTLSLSTLPANPPTVVAGSSTTALTSGTVSGLLPNTTYYGFSRACNGFGCSIYTALGSTSTWANVPVGLSTAALASTSATLAWGANGNPLDTSYRLEQATGIAGPFSLAVSTVGLSAAVAGLSPGVNACFRVAAVDRAGTLTSFTSTICVIPPFTTPGAGSLSVLGTDTLSGSWLSAPGATYYDLRVSTEPINPPVLVAGSSTTVLTSGNVSSLLPNTTYYGFARACNGVGCSSDTALGSTATWANVPVGLSTAALDSISATLAWGANGNPLDTSYQLEQATGIAGPFSLAASTVAVSAAVARLSPGVNACFRVAARDRGGNLTGFTAPLCAVPPFTPPGAGSLSVLGTDTLSGSWLSAPGATYYDLRVSTEPVNPPVLVAGSSTTVLTSGNVSSLLPNTTYYGFVNGCNGAGCSSDTGLGLAVSLAAAPVALSTTAVTAVSVTLGFGVNGNPPGTLFEIDRSTDGVSFALALRTASSGATIGGLAPGGSYSFRVRAVNHAAVPSGYSNIVLVVTPSTPPSVPVNLRGTAGSGTLTYDWNPVGTDTAGTPWPPLTVVTYEVSEANDPSGPFSVVALTTVPFHGPMPSAGAERYVRVRAEAQTLFSPVTPVIDNVGAGRYVYPSPAGTVIVTPQGLLTGVGGPLHRVSLTAGPLTNGAVAALDLAVLDSVSGVSAGDVFFSPAAEVRLPLAGASGERPVEFFNGTGWFLAGTAQVDGAGTARFNAGRTGSYRLTGSTSDSLIQSVAPRVFSPNGDGRNDVTVIRIDNPNGLPAGGTIYDVDGARVADLTPGPAPGLSLLWDGRDDAGQAAEGGIYLYQVTVGDRRATGTVVVVR